MYWPNSLFWETCPRVWVQPPSTPEGSGLRVLPLPSTGSRRFVAGLVGVAWLAVDGAHVALGVGAALGDGEDVVGLVGAGLAADVADAAVAGDDATSSGLLGGTGEGGPG